MDFDAVTLAKGVVAVVASLWVGIPPALGLLLIMMLFDITTGMLAGKNNGELDSHKTYNGLRKKGLVVSLVLMVMILQHYADNNIPALADYHIPSGVAVALFFCAHEALSILENAARGGAPIPQAWREALDRFLAQGEKA